MYFLKKYMLKFIASYYAALYIFIFFPSDKDIMNSEAQADEKDKQNKLPVVSEESSSEDSPTLGKRKRRPPGQWWLSCSENTEETKVTDNRPTLKKAKQSKKELPTTGPSPVKSKKDRVLKKRNQAEPVASSSKNTNKAKEKKTKQNKKRITERGEMADKMKASESVFSATEAEPTEEQQQEEKVLDQDSVESCPLVLAHRDHSQNSGKVNGEGSTECLIVQIKKTPSSSVSTCSAGNANMLILMHQCGLGSQDKFEGL